MSIKTNNSQKRLSPGRVAGFSLVSLVLWLIGLMPFMSETESNVQHLIALVVSMTILSALIWVLRRYRYHTYLITVLASGFSAPAYYLLHPLGIHNEWVFSLIVIAISAQLGTGAGILSALISMTGYGVISYTIGHEQYITEALTNGGVFVASALIVGTLAQNRISALSARAQMADELEQTYESTLKALTNALESRDQDTKWHSERVTKLSLAIAHEMRLSKKTIQQIQLGAILHDVGKIGIPDYILHKPGPLTEDEWKLMHKHPQIGHDMLMGIPFIRPALEIVLYHHEKYDGNGYPIGLSGEFIPLSARIFAVADVYDALISDRPYRRAFPVDDALGEIHKQAGQHFDPEVVRAFECVVKDIEDELE